MSNAHKSSIPDNISEEYYQISPEILSSFPKYRPPLDLFVFKESVAQLQTYIRKGNRLTNEQVEEVKTLCDAGDLFVSRADHPVYSKHIVKQLDLILVDKNLKEKEIADILIQAMTLRLEELFDQPVPVVFERVYKDFMVLTEYLAQDKHRIKALVRRFNPEHNLVNHSVNSGMLALWLLFKTRKDFKRRELDRSAVAFFLHDIGMTRIPAFIRTKNKPLTTDDRAKILQHPMIGAKIARKLELTYDEVQNCILEHQERCDGSGYPRKLRDTDMSRVGRIMAVADSFCAMISERPYAPAKEPKKAAAELAKDVQRYDGQYVSILQASYLSDEF